MKKRTAFTLVELVVVVLIIALLAAVAAPRFLQTTAKARDSTAQHSLTVIRDAIELFVAEEGDFPTTPSTELLPYLRDSSFPESPIGSPTNPAAITVVGTTGPLSADGTPSTGWKYSTADGSFIINSGDSTVLEPAVSYDAW